MGLFVGSGGGAVVGTGGGEDGTTTGRACPVGTLVASDTKVAVGSVVVEVSATWAMTETVDVATEAGVAATAGSAEGLAVVGLAVRVGLAGRGRVGVVEAGAFARANG